MNRNTTLVDSAGSGSSGTGVPLSAPVNLRDLGGLPVAGGTVRTGFALRSDDLATVTEAVAEQLVDEGLRAIIDLRSVDELRVTGRGPLGSRGAVHYHHLPFMTSLSQAGAGGERIPDQSEFGPMYLRFFEQAAPQIVTSLAIMAHAPGAVAFHCAAGADRTGVLAASLLLALGADRDVIVGDYAITGRNISSVHERMAPVLEPLMRRMGVDLDRAARAAIRTEFSSAPMASLLDTLAERYGDPLAPLRAAGLSDSLIGALRERALVA